jgi:hypothetical protein
VLFGSVVILLFSSNLQLRECGECVNIFSSLLNDLTGRPRVIIDLARRYLDHVYDVVSDFLHSASPNSSISSVTVTIY